MLGIKTAGRVFAETQHFSGDDAQPVLLEAAVDFTDDVLPHSIRLDDRQGAFD